MQPLFISRLPAFSHNEMSSFRMCFNDLEAETKYRTWQFKLKLHIMWKIGAVILMSCLGFLAEVASLQFERHFNHIVSLGLGLLVCVGVGFVMLACWRSAPMMLHQLLLFAVVCDCAALALLSDARESSISELNVITMVALLFSPAFPWRWATLLSAVTIFSQWRNPHLNILQALSLVSGMPAACTHRPIPSPASSLFSLCCIPPQTTACKQWKCLSILDGLHCPPGAFAGSLVHLLACPSFIFTCGEWTPSCILQIPKSGNTFCPPSPLPDTEALCQSPPPSLQPYADTAT